MVALPHLLRAKARPLGELRPPGMQALPPGCLPESERGRSSQSRPEVGATSEEARMRSTLGCSGSEAAHGPLGDLPTPFVEDRRGRRGVRTRPRASRPSRQAGEVPLSLLGRPAMNALRWAMLPSIEPRTRERPDTDHPIPDPQPPRAPSPSASRVRLCPTKGITTPGNMTCWKKYEKK